MIACPHRHPLGESYCTACQQDKARAEEKQKILNVLNHRLTEVHNRDVIEELKRLRDAWKP